ncbi:MAG: hypothetical protein E7019_04705 [Alphaproteobacteria bacterium]|nr:hypothetical protein [Alphaproteobacteria bacterium]
MKKFLSICTSVLALSFSAQAQDDIINSNVQKQFAETQAAMEKSLITMDKQMQKVMPVVAESMGQMMQNFFQTLPPLLKSIEENNVLSKAADKMTQEINSQVKQANETFQDYKSYQSEKIIKSKDTFMVSGSTNDNGKILEFSYNQNSDRLKELLNAFSIKSNANSKQTFSLTDLNNQKLKSKDFQMETIASNNYLVYDDGDTYCYITGITENNIIIRVLATGPDAPNRARNFVKSAKTQYVM